MILLEKNKYLENFFKDTERYYLSKSKEIKLDKIKKTLPKDLALYHIEEITFEEDAPRKEAFENVISTLKIDGVNFLYIILGDVYGVNFYFGIVKDLNKDIDLEIDIYDIGKEILKPSIVGNFRGSKVKELEVGKRNKILDEVSKMKYFGVLEGVPGINEENEAFQGVDRLVDIMAGDTFIVSILASSISYKDIEEIENSLYSIYDKLGPLSKKNIQESIGEGLSTGKNITMNKSITKGKNEGKNESLAEQSGSGSNKSTTKGTSENSINKSGSEGSSENYSKTNTTGINFGSSESETNGESITEVETNSSNKGENISYEFINKRVSEWNLYLDEILFKRVDYGKAKGLFNTSILLCADRKSTLTKLGNTMQSLFSGINGNKVPLKLKFLENEMQLQSLKSFQLPYGHINDIDKREQEVRTVLSQFIDNKTKKICLGNWMSSNELSLIAGLPQKEVIGLSLKKEVEFGLNPNNKNLKEENKVDLGKLVKSGNSTEFSVCLDRSHFDKHIFITGVTGSGKTTTCQKILYESKVPFLVIEPAKTEYRILKNTYNDLLIFTLGNDSVAPFRMNPFEFFPHENITSRVDIIKVCIESAFDMEAAIPQLIEAALYKCYEDYGWNISTNKNNKFENPFDDGVYSFPTISDLLNNVTFVATQQGFDERLKNDYIGSIKARLQSLLIGSKGLMLNTPRSIDFRDLLKRNVVLELEEIKSGSEKSLILGFVMANLNEAIKSCYYEAREKNEKFNHITLLEEAHRLLAKFEPGDNPSKKHGVEIFSDMLAEVRKYGESLIIVDQIPNKLTAEVLKNTNTKIVHKIFAKDDKEAIGNTMALEDEQKDFLSYLDTGRAIVTSQNFSKPVQIQIKPLEGISTTETQDIPNKVLRNIILKYYKETYKKGVIFGLNSFEEPPTLENIEIYLEISTELELLKLWKNYFLRFDKNGEALKKWFECRKRNEKFQIYYKFIYQCFYKRNSNKEKIILDQIEKVIQEIIKNENYILKEEDKYYLRIMK